MRDDSIDDGSVLLRVTEFEEVPCAWGEAVRVLR